MDKVIGYKDRTPDAVSAVNRNKELENKLGDLISEIRKDENLNVDQRWVAIAITHFQQGFMALNRAIFQPESNLK